MLSVAGTPREVGHQIGRALGARLEHNIQRYASRRAAGAKVDWDVIDAAALPWLRRLPHRFQDELEGLAAGAGVSLARVASWVYLDTYLAPQCSGLLVRVDGRTWVARNNDAFAPGLWGHAAQRAVDGRIATTTFGLEGDIFTATGFNRRRLWLHYHHWPAPCFASAVAPSVPPHAFLVEALETCASLSEVEELLHAVPRDEAMLLFAVEGATDRFAIYECGVSDYRRRVPTGSYLTATNHAEAEELAADDSAASESIRRRQRLEALVVELLSGSGSEPTSEALMRILADHGIERRGGNFGTVYGNIACPSLGEHWYTFGGYPASSCGNWQKFEPFTYAGACRK